MGSAHQEFTTTHKGCKQSETDPSVAWVTALIPAGNCCNLKYMDFDPAKLNLQMSPWEVLEHSPSQVAAKARPFDLGF